MKVLVTGAKGFIGKNLVLKLKELGSLELVEFDKDSSIASLKDVINDISFVFHLAGINRPKNTEEFAAGNAGVTKELCALIVAAGKKIPILYSSSTQAALDNPYGISKHNAEEVLLDYQRITSAPVFIYRLPNVFGKWSLPHYNSAVATFCHNIANNLPITINDPNVMLELVYIDDVVSGFINCLQTLSSEIFPKIKPTYFITVGELAAQIKKFQAVRFSSITEPVGNGLVKALYATYVSYFKPEQFFYPISKHKDPRGIFAEILKTDNSGQFSFFTCKPGITRGGHYHHTKTEKFLVVKGQARFCFRNVLTDEKYTHYVSDQKLEILDTVPGWVHDITNVGNDEMIVLLWASENFDKNMPDTFMAKL